MAFTRVALAVILSVAFGAARAAEVTVAENLLEYMPDGFVFRNALQGTNTTNAWGSSSQRSVAQFPALQGFGVSQTHFVLEPCGLRPPHWHQRASGILYVIQAKQLEVGFVEEGGQLVANNITTGDSALFPQGYLHYQLNQGCTNAIYTISYNNEDPGTSVAAPTILDLSSTVAAAALGLPTGVLSQIKAATPTGSFAAGTPQCLARCGLPVPTYPVSSCSSSGSASVSG